MKLNIDIFNTNEDYGNFSWTFNVKVFSFKLCLFGVLVTWKYLLTYCTINFSDLPDSL